MTDLIRVFAFRSQGLGRDDTWRRTSDLLEAIEVRGGHATLFVEPLAAVEAGWDLGPRLREILDRGHEVGLRSRLDESTGGVPQRLDRDLQYLRDGDAHPVGFLASGGTIPEEALIWLRGHGFAYAASAHTVEGWTEPHLQDGLVRLPTTTSLVEIARHRGRPLRAGPLAYEFGHLDDDDLNRFAYRMAAGTALRRWGDAGPLITASELSGMIRAHAAH